MSHNLTSCLVVCLLICAGTLGLNEAAVAANYDIVIHHSELQETPIKPNVGDTITFINHADISHNLYLTYEDGRVETLDTQIPNSTKTAVLHSPGRVVVRCWIHPIIRLDLAVSGRN